METRISFNALMQTKKLVDDIRSGGKDYDAYLMEVLLARGFYRYILQETKHRRDYHQYLCPLVEQTNDSIVRLHCRGLHGAERNLFQRHYNSLISVAQRIYFTKQSYFNPARNGLFASTVDNSLVHTAECEALLLSLTH